MRSSGGRYMRAALLLPVNELAVNLPSKRVDHAYLKVLIVGEATVAPVLGKLFAVDDRLSVGAELNADAISHRNAVFHIKEKSLHGDHSLVV
jgi:hypothetical protein